MSNSPHKVINVEMDPISTQNTSPSSPSKTSVIVEQPNGVQDSEASRQETSAQSTTANTSGNYGSSSNPAAQSQPLISVVDPSCQETSQDNAQFRSGGSPSEQGGCNDNERSRMSETGRPTNVASPSPPSPSLPPDEDPHHRLIFRITALVYLIIHMIRHACTREEDTTNRRRNNRN